MISRKTTIAPGARIDVRNEEWLVHRVDRTDTRGYALHVTGCRSWSGTGKRFF